MRALIKAVLIEKKRSEWVFEILEIEFIRVDESFDAGCKKMERKNDIYISCRALGSGSIHCPVSTGVGPIWSER